MYRFGSKLTILLLLAFINAILSSYGFKHLRSSVTTLQKLPYSNQQNRYDLPRLNSAVMDKVKSVVSESLNIDIEKVKPESNFVKDLGADSLQTLEFVMTLEEKFDIKINDEQATKITTVQEAADFIEVALSKDK